MKTCHLIALVIGFAITCHAQQAAPLDADAARSQFQQEVVKPRAYTKAVDPVKERTYTKSGIVRIVRQSGATEELPYVSVPILFRVGTSELLDAVSAQNVSKIADVMRPLIEQGHAFAIEGHASAEGDAGVNRALSAERAAKILSLLSQKPGLNQEKLSARGFGSSQAQHPATASEAERQQDRRVLVVKTN